MSITACLKGRREISLDSCLRRNDEYKQRTKDRRNGKIH